jgi:hypothetical protein
MHQDEVQEIIDKYSTRWKVFRHTAVGPAWVDSFFECIVPAAEANVSIDKYMCGLLANIRRPSKKAAFRLKHTCANVSPLM